MRAIPFLVLSLMVSCAIGCGKKATGETKTTKTPEPAKVEPKPDKGILGELHKANIGGIVFATREIPKEADESFPNTTEVSIGESVFARAYFAKSPANTYAIKGIDCPHDRAWRLRVKVDAAEPVDLDTEPMKDSIWNTWTTLIPRAGDDKHLWGEKKVSYPTDAKLADMKLAQIIQSLPNGDHDFAFDVKVVCKVKEDDKELTRTVAKGLLKVKVDDDGRKKLTENVGPYLVANALTDDAEVARLKKAATTNFKDGKMLEFRVIEPEWRVKRNDAGVPRYRQILAAVVMDKGSNKCEVVGTEIKEDALGGSSYGPSAFADPPAESNLKKMPFPCDNAKKTANAPAAAPATDTKSTK